MHPDRRSVLRAIGLLAAAPIIVRAGSLMPVRVLREDWTGVYWIDEWQNCFYRIPSAPEYWPEDMPCKLIEIARSLARPQHIAFTHVISNDTGDYTFTRKDV